MALYKGGDHSIETVFLLSENLGLVINIQTALIENTDKYSVTHGPVKFYECTMKPHISKLQVLSHKSSFISVQAYLFLYIHKAA